MGRWALLGLLVTALPPSRLTAQASRNWRPDDRALLTDLSYVTAVAATRSVVYAATANGLAVYDRGMRNWRQTVGALDGFPSGQVTGMAADPNDDTAWIAMPGRWVSYEPFTRRLESGILPGTADQVVLDARDPSRGAWFRTSGGWYFVAKGSFAAVRAPDLPANRIGNLSARELMTRLPALDAVRLRIERDDQMRTYRMTSAAITPVTGEIFIGTDGNGTFRVDPVSYGTERLSAGLAGASASAVAFGGGQICVAGEARIRAARSGITCFDESLGDFVYVESIGLAALPLAGVRQVAVTERSVWVATDQGLLRAPRRGGRPVQIRMRDGLPNDRVYSLAAAPTGVYAGTQGGLALVSDSGRAPAGSASGIGPPVLALAGAFGDTVWTGTDAGVIGFLLPLGAGMVRVTGGPGIPEPVFAMAARGDTILAATARELLLREPDGWRRLEPAGRPIGRINAIVADASGFWLAGDQGFAFYEPRSGRWEALATPDDVPFPVHDIAVSRDFVWVATEVGVVRYDKRVLNP